ncbi:MAG: hypothetical protein WC350_00295 [Candidatus Micrarchaeia archaeon]|jgi:hypothetical protein
MSAETIKEASKALDGLIARAKAIAHVKAPGFSNGPAYLKRNELHAFAIRFADKLIEAGFGVVDEKEIKEKLVAAGLWNKKEMLPLVEDDECVFNRGLGQARSNFYVFMKEDADGVTVYFGNPAAKARNGNTEIRMRFTGGDVREAADKAVKEVLTYSSMKSADDYWAVTHHHWGFVQAYRVMDDGVSKFGDVLRMMMRYHIDFDMSTPHNALETRLDPLLMQKLGITHDFIRFLRIIEEGMGMVKVPGVELTMALKANVPNGPHVCVWLADEEAMELFAEKILVRRDPALKMQSYFLGMGFAEMREELRRLRDTLRAAVGVAHPFNFNSRGLPVLDVGLMTATVNGGLGHNDALDFARNSEVIGCWNPTMSDDVMPTEGVLWRGLRPFIKDILDYHDAHVPGSKGWIVRTSNSCNYAFAEYMRGMHGKGIMFDGDDHQTLPLRVGPPQDVVDAIRARKESPVFSEFSSGGDILGMGYSRIHLPPEMKKELEAKGRKPNAGEIVRLLLQAKQYEPSAMDEMVYIVQGQGRPEMDPYRRIVPVGKKDIARELAELQAQAYAGELLDDLGHFIGTGQWPAINAMPGTGDIF